MAAILIDARVQFGLARMRASAQRRTLADAAAQVEVDIELLDAELRAAMSTGQGFDDDRSPLPNCRCVVAPHDDDGRVIEP
jgi:hypothetical protein